ncbi:MAG: GPR endopeptidase [Clostridia bacterium]|nr:GPR endopeptidase [Clostridia bacterium]
MSFRTDLAVELREEKMKNVAERDAGEIDGVIFGETRDGGVVVNTIDVIDERGEMKLGKPRGRYVTVSFGDVGEMGYDEYERICRVISKNISELAGRASDGARSVLVCGLGNRRLAADAVGVIAAEHTLVTRHLKKSDREVFDKAGFFDICAVMPGVLAQTGIETRELILGAVREARPDLIIVVDSLAARKTERLGRAVQLTDTGISPGSGVGNNRAAINIGTTGVPTLAIGVPMVIDSTTLISDALEKAGVTGDISAPDLFVCPKDVDMRTELVGSLIGYAINFAFHGNMTLPEMMIM